MSRRGSRKRAGNRPSKDEKREAARKKRQEQAERTRAAEPVLAGKTGQLNLNNAGDARMYAKAVRMKWIIPDDAFVVAPKKIRDALDREGLSVRQMTSLTRELNRLHATNQRDCVALEATGRSTQQQTQPQSSVTVNVATAVNVGDVRKELMNDPGYLDYLRERAALEDGNAGVVGSNGVGRRLENGGAFEEVGPIPNGHHSGA